MLATIDIGNSTINIGYFLDSGLLVQKIATIPCVLLMNTEGLCLIFSNKNHLEKNFF